MEGFVALILAAITGILADRTVKKAIKDYKKNMEE